MPAYQNPNGQNSHGLIIARVAGPAFGPFTDIGELSSSAISDLMRKEFDASTQNINLDSYILGMLRRNVVKLTVNFLETDATHNEASGLYASIIANSYDGYKMYQTLSGFVWVASGSVQQIQAKTPTDGKWEADVSLRFSGPMYLNGILIQ